MTSQSFPVSPFGLAVLYPTGSEIDAFGTSKMAIEIFFTILISTLGRFNRANKKICHIHFHKLHHGKKLNNPRTKEVSQ